MSDANRILALSSISEADGKLAPKVIPEEDVEFKLSPEAYRLGASILLAHVLFCVISGSFGVPTILDLFLAVELGCEKTWARLWVLIRATLGLFLVLPICLRELEPLVIALSCTMQILLCSSLIVILAGQSKPWRYFDCFRFAFCLCSTVPSSCAVYNGTGEPVRCA